MLSLWCSYTEPYSHLMKPNWFFCIGWRRRSSWTIHSSKTVMCCWTSKSKVEYLFDTVGSRTDYNIFHNSRFHNNMGIGTSQTCSKSAKIIYIDRQLLSSSIIRLVQLILDFVWFTMNKRSKQNPKTNNPELCSFFTHRLVIINKAEQYSPTFISFHFICFFL